MEDPCKNCSDIKVDDYGYFCDMACGKHTAYQNFKAGEEQGIQKGRREVVEWIQKRDCPYTIFVEKVHVFKVVDLEWQSKLKEWGLLASLGH